MKQFLKVTFVVLAITAIFWSAKQMRQQSAENTSGTIYMLAGKGGI